MGGEKVQRKYKNDTDVEPDLVIYESRESGENERERRWLAVHACVGIQIDFKRAGVERIWGNKYRIES